MKGNGGYLFCQPHNRNVTNPAYIPLKEEVEAFLELYTQYHGPGTTAEREEKWPTIMKMYDSLVGAYNNNKKIDVAVKVMKFGNGALKNYKFQRSQAAQVANATALLHAAPSAFAEIGNMFKAPVTTTQLGLDPAAGAPEGATPAAGAAAAAAAGANADIEEGVELESMD